MTEPTATADPRAMSPEELREHADELEGHWLAFEVVHGPWYSDGNGPLEDGGYADHVLVESPSAEIVRLASHAHAAGALDVYVGLDLSDVEPDEESAAKLEQAQGEWLEEVRDPTGRVVRPGRWTGPWHEGHAAQVELDEAYKPVAQAEERLTEALVALVDLEEVGKAVPQEVIDAEAAARAEVEQAREEFAAVGQRITARLERSAEAETQEIAADDVGGVPETLGGEQ